MANKGLDYAWHGVIDWSCFQQSGVTFIMRYFSYDASKDLTADELANANLHGISVGVVWETTANRMLQGHAAGSSDAAEANRRANSLGINGIPLYFACDFDATESDQTLINAYMDGVISVIGLARAGMYGGFYPVSRAFNARKITYGWQTYAWSGGQWDQRAQLRQVQNDVTVCSINADWDEQHATDFGQWPRPKGPDPMPPDPAQPAQPVLQSTWKWCRKCQVLFYAPNTSAGGVCAAGGQHDGAQSGEYLLTVVP